MPGISSENVNDVTRLLSGSFGIGGHNGMILPNSSAPLKTRRMLFAKKKKIASQCIIHNNVLPINKSSINA
jgi:hypothetical protein